MKDYIYLECRIGTTIGLSDSLIKKTRRSVLEPDEDFKKVQGRIAYTAEAVAKLVGFLRGPESGGGTRSKAEAARITEVLLAAVVQPVPAEKTATLPEETGEVESIPPERRLPLPWVYWTVPDAVLIVTRIYPSNGKIMHGRLDPEWIKKNGEAFQKKTGVDPEQIRHRIQVRQGYTKKFTIAMEVPCRWKQSDLWECSRPMPKRKGRWS